MTGAQSRIVFTITKTGIFLLLKPMLVSHSYFHFRFCFGKILQVDVTSLECSRITELQMSY